jgi:hypothetical protein
VYHGRLAFAGGFIAQMNDESVARADLAALEELDD